MSRAVHAVHDHPVAAGSGACRRGNHNRVLRCACGRYGGMPPQQMKLQKSSAAPGGPVSTID